MTKSGHIGKNAARIALNGKAADQERGSQAGSEKAVKDTHEKTGGPSEIARIPVVGRAYAELKSCRVNNKESPDEGDGGSTAKVLQKETVGTVDSTDIDIMSVHWKYRELARPKQHGLAGREEHLYSWMCITCTEDKRLTGDARGHRPLDMTPAADARSPSSGRDACHPRKIAVRPNSVGAIPFSQAMMGECESPNAAARQLRLAFSCHEPIRGGHTVMMVLSSASLLLLLVSSLSSSSSSLSWPSSFASPALLSSSLSSLLSSPG